MLEYLLLRNRNCDINRPWRSRLTAGSDSLYLAKLCGRELQYFYRKAFTSSVQLPVLCFAVNKKDSDSNLRLLGCDGHVYRVVPCHHISPITVLGSWPTDLTDYATRYQPPRIVSLLGK